MSAASLLEVNETTDKKGKKYYEYSILNRTADGDEGGRHQIIKATVANGKLYIIKAQCGDKRWFKGVKNGALWRLRGMEGEGVGFFCWVCGEGRRSGTPHAHTRARSQHTRAPPKQTNTQTNTKNIQTAQQR